jgi:hypothetical protein
MIAMPDKRLIARAKKYGMQIAKDPALMAISTCRLFAKE